MTQTKRNSAFLFFLLLLLCEQVMASVQVEQDFYQGLSPVMKDEFTAFFTPVGQFDLQRFRHTKNLRKGKQVFHLKVPDDMDIRKKVGYAHKANLVVHHGARTLDSILYAVTYDYNEYGRRMVLPQRSEASNHFIFAGGSFAHGTGLAAKDTISYQLLSDQENFQEVNIAVAGSGPNTMLAITQSELPKSVKQAKGVFLYIYNDFHIDRSNGFAMQRDWLKDSPYFEKNNQGKWVNKGSFKEADSFKTMFYHGLLKLFSTLGLNYNFPRRSSSHIEYTCELIAASRNSYLKAFPLGKFYLYPHPFSPLIDEMNSCLKRKNITIIPTKGSWKPDQHEIPYERHPNAKGASMVAQELRRFLQKQILFK